MAKYEYSFDGEIELLDFGRMAYTVVYLPPRLVADLPLDDHPRLRVDGEVNGATFHGAVQPAGSGAYYFILSKSFLRTGRMKQGDVVAVCFNIADQDAVEVPSELQFALDADERAAEIWAHLTAGKRRGLAYRVASAKRTATRELRVEEVLETLWQLNRATG